MTCVDIIIQHVLRAYVTFLPEDTVAYGPMAKPEVRAPLCPRAKKKITYCPQTMKYYLYYMLLYDIKIHLRTYETSV